MAIRGIREYDGKKLMAQVLDRFAAKPVGMNPNFALVTPETDLEKLPESEPWLKTTKLVVKPDMLFGKRGKNNLLKLNATWDEAAAWIRAKREETVTVSGVAGRLTEFLIEPFTPHPEDKEYYVAMRSFRDEDVVYFSLKGGIYVEENWDQVKEIHLPVMVDGKLVDSKSVSFEGQLPVEGPEKALIENFVTALYRFYADQGFAYLEINPFTLADGKVVPLDLVAKMDDTASFEHLDTWGTTLTFPAGFGRTLNADEKKVKDLDAKTGASLKLTVLNPDGRIWPMVAGGGASVIFADTVADLGYMHELGMYGEYSGDPNEEFTYQYACVILDLMTRKHDPKGKALLIGGGIANFTDVAATFKGIIRAITQYADKLREGKVRIYVRRGGPNYKVGLEQMRALGGKLELPIEVYGPETHMTNIVPMAIAALQ